MAEDDDFDEADEPAATVPERRGRLTALTVGLAILSVVAVAACLHRAAEAFLEKNAPAVAMNWGLASPGAWSALAEIRLADTRSPGHDAQAVQFARTALLAAPMDERAVRVLALEAERAGGLAHARMLMVVSDRLTRRDDFAQLWLFSHALREQDWRGASLHADALLRNQDEFQNALFPLMAGALTDPAAVTPFVDRLSADPDWRHPFLRALATHAVDPAVPTRLFEALAATSTPTDDQDNGYLVSRYAAQGDYVGARALWLRLLPRGAARPDSLVYNGDFQPLPGAAPFNWQLVTTQGVIAEYDASKDGHTALHVLTPAAQTAPAAMELLSLPPGTYRLTGLALVEPGQSGDVFSWRISCLGHDDAPLAATALNGGAMGWRPFSASFAVPDQGCGAQWLALIGLAHEGFEPAEAWYRALRVTPAAPAAPPPPKPAGVFPAKA